MCEGDACPAYGSFRAHAASRQDPAIAVRPTKPNGTGRERPGDLRFPGFHAVLASNTREVVGPGHEDTQGEASEGDQSSRRTLPTPSARPAQGAARSAHEANRRARKLLRGQRKYRRVEPTFAYGQRAVVQVAQSKESAQTPQLGAVPRLSESLSATKAHCAGPDVDSHSLSHESVQRKSRMVEISKYGSEGVPGAQAPGTIRPPATRRRVGQAGHLDHHHGGINPHPVKREQGKGGYYHKQRAAQQGQDKDDGFEHGHGRLFNYLPVCSMASTSRIFADNFWRLKGFSMKCTSVSRTP